jgi:hypothetical protein
MLTNNSQNSSNNNNQSDIEDTWSEISSVHENFEWDSESLLTSAASNNNHVQIFNNENRNNSQNTNDSLGVLTGRLDSSNVTTTTTSDAEYINDDDNVSVVSLDSHVSIESRNSNTSGVSGISAAVSIGSIGSIPSVISVATQNSRRHHNNNSGSVEYMAPGSMNVTQELHRQQQLVEELRAQVVGLTQERDQALEMASENRALYERQVARNERLEEQNVRIYQTNAALQHYAKKQKKSSEKKMKKQMEGKRGKQRPYVPAKLRFRHSRTTHRSVCSAGRHW